MFASLLVCLSLLLLPPPLSEAEREQVRSGAGSPQIVQDAAFEALLGNVQRWEEGAAAPADAAPLPPRRYGELEPGEVALLEGDLLRAEAMPPPFPEVRRWVVAVPSVDARVQLLVLFVPASEATERIETLHTPRLRLHARFYKVMRLPSGGTLKPYPAFVGGQPRVATPAADPAGPTLPLLFIAILLAAGLLLVAVFTAVLARSRGGGARGRHASADGDLSEYDPSEPLPAEPAEALGELARRSEETP
jgi:hypothetical protein